MLSFSLVPQVYAQGANQAVNTGLNVCDPSQNGLNLGNCLKLNNSGTTVADIYQRPADIVNVIVPAIFAFAGAMLVVTLFMAGFKFIRHGTKGKDEAKTMLTTAMIGFAIMFIAYWIVRILEIVIGMEIIF